MKLRVEKRITEGCPEGVWGVVAEDRFYPYGEKDETREWMDSKPKYEFIGSAWTYEPLSECPLVSGATPSTYSFVSKEENVDYARILREAPQGEKFILVEVKNKAGRTLSWCLFVHDSVLKDSAVRNLVLAQEALYPEWGWSGESSSSYRMRDGSGKVPGLIKQEIEAIKSALSGRVRTTVTYL